MYYSMLLLKVQIAKSTLRTQFDGNLLFALRNIDRLLMTDGPYTRSLLASKQPR